MRVFNFPGDIKETSTLTVTKKDALMNDEHGILPIVGQLWQILGLGSLSKHVHKR